MRRLIHSISVLYITILVVGCSQSKEQKDSQIEAASSTDTASIDQALQALQTESLTDGLGHSISDTTIYFKDFFSNDKFLAYRLYHQSGHVSDPCPKCDKNMNGGSSRKKKKKMRDFAFFRPPSFKHVALGFNSKIDSTDFTASHWGLIQQVDIYVGNAPTSIMLAYELCNQPLHDDCPHQHNPHPTLPTRFDVVQGSQVLYEDSLRQFEFDIYSDGDEYGLVTSDSAFVLAINNKKTPLALNMPVRYKIGKLNLTYDSKSFSIPVAYDIEKK